MSKWIADGTEVREVDEEYSNYVFDTSTPEEAEQVVACVNAFGSRDPEDCVVVDRVTFTRLLDFLHRLSEQEADSPPYSYGCSNCIAKYNWEACEICENLQSRDKEDSNGN